jgi:hypothetical protein
MPGVGIGSMNEPEIQRRHLTSHKVNGLNESLDITTRDATGPGGAHHAYQIEWPDTIVDPPGGGHKGGHEARINFQKGPIAEEGVNGVSNESLLAIVEDRLKSFQAGPFSCRENAIALTHIQDALHWLHHRTRERLARGVEGTSRI